MTYCGERTLVKSQPGAREAVTMRCRSWLCADCEPARRRQLIATAHRGRPNTFITLTCRRTDDLTPDQAALELSNAWRILVKRALREARRDVTKQPLPSSGSMHTVWKIGPEGYVPRQIKLINGKLPFLAVFEQHVSGWPHMHLLARSTWLAQAWLSLQMNELLRSPVVSIMRVSHKGKVAAYVTKYCGKAAKKFATAKRYWQTRDYQLTKYEAKNAPLNEEEGVWIEKNPIKRVVSYWTRTGWEIEWKSPNHVLASHHPPP